MFVSENHRSVTTWETFDDAHAAFNKIVVHKTRLNDLKELGFDPHVTPNIKVLNYLDIIERFIPNSSITKDDLHPDVRQCIELKEGCMGYDLDLDIIRKRRFGNLVVYKLRSGQPNVDKVERKIKPHGPFQEVDGLVSRIPGL